MAVAVCCITCNGFTKYYVCGQGILGLGYSPLVQPFGHNIPSVVELIISEAKLNDMFTLQLCASQLDDSTYGSLIFSGHDAR